MNIGISTLATLFRAGQYGIIYPTPQRSLLIHINQHFTQVIGLSGVRWRVYREKKAEELFRYVTI